MIQIFLSIYLLNKINVLICLTVDYFLSFFQFIIIYFLFFMYLFINFVHFWRLFTENELLTDLTAIVTLSRGCEALLAAVDDHFRNVRTVS